MCVQGKLTFWNLLSSSLEFISIYKGCEGWKIWRKRTQKNGAQHLGVNVYMDRTVIWIVHNLSVRFNCPLGSSSWMFLLFSVISIAGQCGLRPLKASNSLHCHTVLWPKKEKRTMSFLGLSAPKTRNNALSSTSKTWKMIW